MAKCTICHKWGLHESMLRPIPNMEATNKACIGCIHFIKKYGLQKAKDIILQLKHEDEKRKKWRR